MKNKIQYIVYSHLRDELYDVASGCFAIVRQQGVVTVELVHLREIRFTYADYYDTHRVATGLNTLVRKQLML